MKRRQQDGLGYLIITEPGAPTKEQDCFTCRHCQQVVFVAPKCAPSDAGGICRQCWGLICPDCCSKGTCTPVLKWVEAETRRYEDLRTRGY